MAKPAKVKKNSDPAMSAKKGEKKAAAEGTVKDAPAKDKAVASKGKKEAAKGFKGRLAKAQAAKAKPAKGAKKERKSAGKFIREVRVELSKVTWPTRQELFQSTMVVLIAVTIAGTFIAILDAFFSRLITLIS